MLGEKAWPDLRSAADALGRPIDHVYIMAPAEAVPAVIADCARARVPVGRLARGLSIPLDPAVRIDVLHPPPEGVPGAPAESNDQSLVLRVQYGAVALLLTGDLEEAGLPDLLDSGRELRAQVLKVPHHGSRLGAAGETFFRRVAPEIALLSVGQRAHLPSPETLEALRRTNTRVYSTRACGAIRVRTDGF